MKTLAVLIFLFAQNVFASTTGHTDRCEIRNGEALIYVCVRGVYTGSGHADIFFYDEDGDQIDKTGTSWSGSGSNECIEILRVSAPSRAAFCDAKLTD